MPYTNHYNHSCIIVKTSFIALKESPLHDLSNGILSLGVSNIIAEIL